MTIGRYDEAFASGTLPPVAGPSPRLVSRRPASSCDLSSDTATALERCHDVPPEPSAGGRQPSAAAAFRLDLAPVTVIGLVQ